MEDESNFEDAHANRRTFMEALSSVVRPSAAAAPETLNFGNINCGIGDVSLAAKNLGMNLVLAVEEDEATREAYAANIGLTPAPALPLTLTRLPRVDLLWARLPAGAFTLDEPIMEPRPFDEAARLMRVGRPAGVVLEGHWQWSSGVLLAVADMERAGYTVSHHTVFDRNIMVGTLRPRPERQQEEDPAPTDGDGMGINAMTILSNKGFPHGWRLPECQAAAVRLASEALPVGLAMVMLGW